MPLHWAKVPEWLPSLACATNSTRNEMDWTIEEYLEFERQLLEQAEEDEEYQEDDPVYWC